LATTYEDVEKVFASIFADKQVVSDELVSQWFDMALGEYELEIEPLIYDNVTKEFDSDLARPVINVLGYIVKKFYQERLISLTNKRNNIVTSDISMTGTDSAKSHMETELNQIKESIRSYYANLKTPAYN